MVRALLFLAAASCSLVPHQDDPVETVRYEIDLFAQSVEDHPGDPVGILTEGLGASGAESRRLPNGEQLAELIRRHIDEESWDKEPVSVAARGGVLTVTHRRSVQARIARFLDAWRPFAGQLIVLDAEIVAVDPLLLSKIRAAGNPDRPGALSPEQHRRLLELAREGKAAELVRTMRLTARSGQRVSLQELVKRQYVQDFDVQISAADGTLDPVVGVLATGPSVDVCPFLEPAGGITLVARLDAADFESMEERKLRIPKAIFPAAPVEAEAGKVPAKGAATRQVLEQKIQLPRIQHDRIRMVASVRERETAIAGSLLRQGRERLFLITPAAVAEEEKPALPPPPQGPKAMRIFDISALTRPIQDWAGPSLDLVSPARGGGGPLTGATYTLDEPSVFMGVAEVREEIRSRIAPDSWEDKSHALEEAGGALLLVRHKPEVLAEIEKLLGSLIAARLRTVTTEAVVIGFRKGSRAEWEKEIPALAPGGYAVDAAPFDRLLEESARGERVRLVDRSEVTGLPGQRVHTLRSRQEAFVSDYEPQVSTMVSVMDPIVGTFITGFSLDVRPRPVQGKIAVELRAAMATGELKDTDAVESTAGALQTPQARILKWTSTASCSKDRWSLVALETVGNGDDAEEFAVFVRARLNR
jgi:hypothetical protein